MQPTSSIKFFIVTLLVLQSLCSLAQRSHYYDYEGLTYRLAWKEAAAMEDDLLRDSARLKAIFSPCTISWYTFNRAEEETKFNFNQALAERLNGLLKREYLDDDKRNKFTSSADTVVSFNQFSKDINDQAQRYTSSKLLYASCRDFRREAGLSMQFDERPSLVDSGIGAKMPERFPLVGPVQVPTAPIINNDPTGKDTSLTGIKTGRDSVLTVFPKKPGNNNPLQSKVTSPDTPTVEGNKVADTLIPKIEDNMGFDTSTAKVKIIEEPVTPPVVIDPPSDYYWILPCLVAGLAGSIWLWWFYRRAFQMVKIRAIPMNLREYILTTAQLLQLEYTHGFVIGYLPRNKLKRLDKAQIIYRIVNTHQQLIITPGNPRKIKYTMRRERFLPGKVTPLQATGGRYAHNTSAPVAENDFSQDHFSGFYIISLDTPLLSHHVSALKEIQVEVIQYLRTNNYLVYVSNKQQYLDLAEGRGFHQENRIGQGFSFIKMIQPWTSKDIGFFTAGDPSKKVLILDVMPHRERDTESLLPFLNRAGIRIQVSNDLLIRIEVAYDSVGLLLNNKYIHAIYEYVAPELNNDRASFLVGSSIADVVNKLPYTGKGELIAVADTGIDASHPDLRDRIEVEDMSSWGRKKTADCSDQHGHGTHIAGSIVGTGLASQGKIKGIAPGAKLFFQSLMNEKGPMAGQPDDLRKLFKEAYNHGARIHNCSWGADKSSVYEAMAQQVDHFCYRHKDLLVVMAAGNSGMSIAPKHVRSGYVDLYSINAPGSAKNVLTVGASRSDRVMGGYARYTYGDVYPKAHPYPPIGKEKVSGDPDALAAYSSRGPCNDYRIKPDIVAPGTDILSTWPRGVQENFDGPKHNSWYAYKGGTSMAAALVSGAAALVREYYRQRWKYATPSAALIKATVINGTKKLSADDALHDLNDIPNYNQGFGMLDLLHTIPNSDKNFYIHFWDSIDLENIDMRIPGDNYVISFELKQPSWIRVCLAYHDWHYNAIQTDFSIFLSNEDRKWHGNETLERTFNTYEEDDHDKNNNVEIIRVEEARPGSYTLKVLLSRLPFDSKGEHFALVLTTGDRGAAVLQQGMDTLPG